MKKYLLILFLFPVLSFGQKLGIKNEKLTYDQHDFLKEVNKNYPDIVIGENAYTHLEDGHVVYYQVQLKSNATQGYDFVPNDFDKADIYYRISPDNKHIYYNIKAKGIHGDIYKIGSDYINIQVSDKDELAYFINGKQKM